MSPNDNQIDARAFTRSPMTTSTTSSIKTPPDSGKKRKRVSKSERKRRKRLREEAERDAKTSTTVDCVTASVSTSIGSSKSSCVATNGGSTNDENIVTNTTPTKSPTAKRAKKKKKRQSKATIGDGDPIETIQNSSNETMDEKRSIVNTPTSTLSPARQKDAQDPTQSNNAKGKILLEDAPSVISTSTSATENGSRSNSNVHAMKLISETSMTARSVEFVFSSKSQMSKGISKNGKNGKIMIPYIHSKLRKKKSSESPHEEKDGVGMERNGRQTQETSHLINEGIDDILFPQRKKKKGVEADANGNSNINGDEKDVKKVGNSQNKDDVLLSPHPVTPNQKKKKVKTRSDPLSSTSDPDAKTKNRISPTIISDSDAKIKSKKMKRHSLDANFKVPANIDTNEEEAAESKHLSHTPSKEPEHAPTQKTGRSRSDSLSDPMKNRLSGRTVHDAIHDESGKRPRSNSTDGELNLPQRGLCDERIVMKNYQWDVETYRHSHPRGLINLGNTCFLNSTLQCLAYLPTFSQCVADLPPTNPRSNNGGYSNHHLHNKKKKHSNGSVSGNNNGLIITQHLRSFVRKAHGLDGERKQGPLKPGSIVRSISLLGGGNRGYKFRPGRQEDAHEFLVHLLDSMNNGELKAAGIDPKVSGWRDRLPIPRLDETTLTHRMFGGYLRSQVSCTKCKYKSNTYDPFLDLSLEVSGKKVNSLHDALAEYTRKETLDTANKWKCSGCNKKVCATKQLTIFRPPLTLCIQLKRFSFGGGFGGYMHHQSFGFGHFSGKGMRMMQGGSKIQKPIEFPATLKLPLSDGRKCEYLLTGVVIHVGGSATSGHYTAFVRKAGKQNTTQWYNMDDSYVDHVSEKTVLRHIKDAYVLFYCRKEVQLELPSPPPRSYSNAAEAVKAAEARKKARSLIKSKSDEKPLPTSDVTTPSKKHSKVKEARAPPGTSAENKKKEEVNDKSDSATNSPSKTKSKSTSSIDESSSNDGESTSGSDCEDDDNAMGGTNNVTKMNRISEKTQDQMQATPKSEDKRAKKDAANPSTTQLTNAGITTPPSNKKVSDPVSNDKKKDFSLDLGSKKGVMNINMNSLKKKKNKKNKPWRPPLASSPKAGSDSNLLGNASVSKWGDDEDADEELGARAAGVKKKEAKLREQVFKETKMREKERKRKMYLDSWDAGLDAGRVKKVKQKDSSSLTPFGSTSGSSSQDQKENPFHRIQQSMMQMKRGKAKGHGNQVTSMKKKRQKIR